MTPPIPASARRSLKRSKLAGSWFVGRQVRGLWVKTCTDSPPIASIRSIAVSIPPEEETWAPRSTPRTLAEELGQPPRLVLQLAAGRPRQRCERLRHDPPALETPDARHQAVREERLLDVGIRLEDGSAVLLREQRPAVE